MEYENDSIFTYVEKLLKGIRPEGFNIAMFASKHSYIDTRLKELKNILIKYYPEKGNRNLLNEVLFDLFNCEQDLVSHERVEDYLFVPAGLTIYAILNKLVNPCLTISHRQTGICFSFLNGYVIMTN